MRFDGDRLVASGTRGVVDRNYPRPVTIEDRPRVASITKFVVALGVMRLVEQKKLDLNRDVSDYLGWELRNPAYPDKKITLAMLLSHTSSLRDNGEGYLIRWGDTVEGAVKDPAMWDQTHAPGGFFNYGNINFPVIGSVVEKVTGQRFDKAMDALVLEPLDMRACFNWGGRCTDRDAERAVVLYRPNGDVAQDNLSRKLPACPVFRKQDATDCDLSTYIIGTNGGLFSPQGGLRISPKELAQIGQMMARGGTTEDGTRFLSAASVKMMLKSHWQYDGKNGATDGGFYCAYGLATQILGLNRHQECRDRLPGQTSVWYGHSGEAYALRSGLWFDPKTGKGIAYYATAVSDTPPESGPSAFTRTEQWLASRQ